MNIGKEIMRRTLAGETLSVHDRDAFDDWKIDQSSDDILDAIIELRFQWKDVAEGLPEVSGRYLTPESPYPAQFRKGDADNEAWFRKRFTAYFGPIPPYEKKEESNDDRT